MQLTDNDLTQPISGDLPDDFFIPDDDYDSVTFGKPSHGLDPSEQASGVTEGKTSAAPILSEVLLHTINEQVSKAIAAAVQSAAAKP